MALVVFFSCCYLGTVCLHRNAMKFDSFKDSQWRLQFPVWSVTMLSSHHPSECFVLMSGCIVVHLIWREKCEWACILDLSSESKQDALKSFMKGWRELHWSWWWRQLCNMRPVGWKWWERASDREFFSFICTGKSTECNRKSRQNLKANFYLVQRAWLGCDLSLDSWYKALGSSITARSPIFTPVTLGLLETTDVSVLPLIQKHTVVVTTAFAVCP